VVFSSLARNLVANDTNNTSDVFVRGTVTPPPAPVRVAVKNARTASEGGATTPGSATFILELSAAGRLPVTVYVGTLNGTATAGDDYISREGRLTFAPGETRKTVVINFKGDAIPELNETFFLRIQWATDAIIADSRGSAYIRNDDGPSITIDNAVTVNEGNSGTTPQTFTVRLSAASTNTITVDWATANGTAGPADYVVASGRLTFAPGETQKTITVQVKGDTIVEPNETYRVNLMRPTLAIIGDSQAVAYIRNDDGAPGISGQSQPSR
jgi:LysM repeat protein